MPRSPHEEESHLMMLRQGASLRLHLERTYVLGMKRNLAFRCSNPDPKAVNARKQRHGVEPELNFLNAGAQIDGIIQRIVGREVNEICCMGADDIANPL